MERGVDFAAIVKMQSYAKCFSVATVAASGVTLNEFYTLKIIQAFSPCTWAELLREFSKATPTNNAHSLRSRLSRVVKQLEAKGAIQRSCLSDHRYQELRVTRSGERLLQRVTKAMIGAAQHYTQNVDEFFPAATPQPLVNFYEKE